MPCMAWEHRYRELIILYCLSAFLALLAFFSRLLRLRSCASAFLTWFRGLCRGLPASRDELGDMVCEQMLQRKVVHYRTLLQLISFTLLASEASIVAQLLAGVDCDQTQTQDVVLLLLQALSTIGVLRPEYISARSLDTFYVAMALGAAVYVSPFSCKEVFLIRALLIANIFMASLNLCRRTRARRRLPVFLLCNLVFCLSAVCAILVVGKRHLENAPKVAQWQVVVVISFSLGPHLLELSFSSAVQQSLQLDAVRELFAAASALLHIFCECTVELNASGVIDSGAQDLGSYLMKGSLNYSLKGIHLADLLLDSADQDIFRARLQEPRLQRMGMPECMPVSMRDGIGNCLRLELLWFEFRHVDGKRRYMVGVRELLDRQAATGRPAVGNLSRAEEDSFEVSEEESFVTTDEPSAALLVVDTMNDGFPIQGQTPNLVAQIGRLPLGEGLSGFVRDSAPFMAWVQSEAMSEVKGSYKLILSVPLGQFRARCRVLLQSTGSDVAPASLEAVGLQFTHIRPLEKGRPCRLRGTPSVPFTVTASL